MTKSVLVVEDELIISKDIRNMLESMDFSVCAHAKSGEEALRHFTTCNPDIILMDIILQGEIDGITVSSMIRETSDVPIIYITAHTDRSTIERAKATNPQGYLRKPILKQDLYCALELAISQFETGRKLKQSEEKFRSIFSNSPFGIGLYNAEGILIDVNPAFLTLLGAHDRNELLGLSLYSIPDLPDSFKEKIQRGESFNEVFEYSFDKIGEVRRFTTMKKGKALFEFFFRPFSMSDSTQSDGYLLHLVDITKQKEMEELTKRQQQRLIQADKLASLGILAAGIAHEINNPNQAIMSNTGYLKNAWKTVTPILDAYFEENGDFLIDGMDYSAVREELEEYHTLIADCTRRIDTIIQDLKAFARYEADPQMTEIDVNIVLHSAITLSRNFIKKSTHNFSVEYGENLPKIKANSQKLGQVFINLIQNACQSLTDMNERVTIRSFRQTENNHIVIEVTDEGEGIPREVIDKIKDPFFTTKKGEGTGLGLSVSDSIIEEHNGRLVFESAENRGTTVRLFLPLRGGGGERYGEE